MGGGASTAKKKPKWKRLFYLTTNTEDRSGESYQQIFPIWSMAMTRNQRQLATATSDNRINLWCLVTHKLLIPLAGHADTIWRVAYSPDDTILASASADGTVRLWEVGTGLPLMTLPRNHANWVWSLAWTPDGSRLATGGSDARILLWDVGQAVEASIKLQQATEEARQDSYFLEELANRVEEMSALAKPVLYWQAHEKSITDLQFSPPEPQLLISAGSEGSIAVWDSGTGHLDCRVMGHIGAVNCVAVSPMLGEVVASGGEDHTVRLWDMRDIDPGSGNAKASREKQMGFNLAHFTLKGHTGGISAVRFLGDGKLLASCSKDCDVRVWLPDMQNPTLLVTWTAHEAWVRDLLWTPCQRYLYTASSDGLAYAWHVPRKHHLKGHGRRKPNATVAAKYNV
jgi:WD40 repeat protein